jgi:hypothetical protein
MVAFFTLVALVVAGLAVAAVVGFVLLLLKLVLWTVLLPFRILFKLLMLPVYLTVGAIGLAAAAVALPVLLVVFGGVLLVGLVAGLFALFLPLIPFVLLGLVVWAIVKPRPTAIVS